VTTTVTNAVAQRDSSPGALIATYADDFARVLPAHVKPATFVRLAQGVLRRDDNLARAAISNPGALMAALLDCARLGHDPGTNAYWLIPFKGEIQGIEGYLGKIERIYRAGAVASVKAEIVRANDHWRFDRKTMDRPDHQFDDFASDEDRGPLRGVYAYAEMVNGATSRVVTMGRAEVMKHKAMAKGADRPDSPWQKWEPSMWLRCAVGELEKWVPSSSEYRLAVARAAAEGGATAPARRPQPARSPDVLDGEVVEQPEPSLDGEAWPTTASVPGEAS